MNTAVGDTQCAAESIEIWHGKRGLITFKTDMKMREHLQEIAQSISISGKLSAGHLQ